MQERESIKEGKDELPQVSCFFNEYGMKQKHQTDLDRLLSTKSTTSCRDFEVYYHALYMVSIVYLRCKSDSLSNVRYEHGCH